MVPQTIEAGAPFPRHRGAVARTGAGRRAPRRPAGRAGRPAWWARRAAKATPWRCRGTYAYLGIGPRVVVLDVSVPAAPVLTGRSAPLPDIVQGLAASGNTVYVADGESGLQIIDVTNPASPKWEGSLDTPGSAQNVAVSGTTAYVADGDGGLRIVDVSNPLAPVEVAALTAPTLGGEVNGHCRGREHGLRGRRRRRAGDRGRDRSRKSADPGPLPGPGLDRTRRGRPWRHRLRGRQRQPQGCSRSTSRTPSLRSSSSLTCPDRAYPTISYVAGSYLYVAMGENGRGRLPDRPGDRRAHFQVTHDTPGVAHDVAAVRRLCLCGGRPGGPAYRRRAHQHPLAGRGGRLPDVGRCPGGGCQRQPRLRGGGGGRAERHEPDRPGEPGADRQRGHTRLCPGRSS